MGSAEALGGLAQDRFHYSIKIADDIAIPEAQNRPSCFCQKLRAVRIIFLSIEMLGAIKLDRKFRRTAGKVNDIRTNYQLAREARALAVIWSGTRRIAVS